METNIKNLTTYKKGDKREVFDTEENESRLKIYIKSKLKVYDIVAVGKAVIDREEFCASKFTFTVMKDDVVSFNQGDAVSVKYNSEGIFFGYVFTKSRNKKGLIEVVAYDQLRYLKNRRTYTRGRMTLQEVVQQIARDCSLRVGEIEKSSVYLPCVAADNVSLLDVILKACSDTHALSGKRYILYDDCGYLYLTCEEKLDVNVVVDSHSACDAVYTDTIDEGVYNTIQLYNDTKKLNQRALVTVTDKQTADAWGTIILSKKMTDPERGKEEAEALLYEYNRINRQLVIKGVPGDGRFMPGCSIYVQLVTGDLNIDGYVRVKKTVHVFENNVYTADLYLDGSELSEYS